MAKNNQKARDYPFTVKEYKSSLSNRQPRQPRYEIFGPNGKCLGLPMENNPAVDALRWLQMGFKFGVAELAGVLEDLVGEVEEHRRLSKASGVRPSVSHNRVSRARKVLDKLKKLEDERAEH